MLRDHGEVLDVKIRIIQASEGTQYNTPTATEIAGLLVGDGHENFESSDVIVQKRDGTLQRINETHPSYMAGVKTSQEGLPLVHQDQLLQ